MTEAELCQRARSLDWPDIQQIWTLLKDRGDVLQEWTTPGDNKSGNGKGNAFQYLIVRGFELSLGVSEVSYPFGVRFPYGISPSGRDLEQLDGFVRLGQLGFLIESKNYADSLGFDPIAKLRDKLMRRPNATIGCVFSMKGFTSAAMVLVGYVAPHTILLWDGPEIERCILVRDFAGTLLAKYHNLQRNGHQDFNEGNDYQKSKRKRSNRK